MWKNCLRTGIRHRQIAPFDVSEAYYENASLRLIFWKKSLCLIRSHPALGVGAGNWRLAVPGCRNPVNPEHTMNNYTYSQPHNEWICILSETGIVGLILALLIFILPVYIIIYRLVFSGSRPPMFAFMFSKIPLKITKVPLIWKMPRRLFSPLFLGLLIFTVVLSSIRIRSEYFTLKMFRNERKKDEYVIYYNRSADNIFYRITPNTLPLAWFEGVAWYRSGQTESAVTCFEKALRCTPYEVRVLNDYGISLFNLHRTGEAKSILHRSIEIDPFFDDARFNLAAIHYLTSRPDSALYYVKSCRESRKKEEYLKELGE
jgi:tetratricopeptide (TPR) repeat protein